MKRIDKYVLKSYFFSLLVCLFSLVGLFVVIDLFQKIDKFMRKGDDRIGLIATYYAWQVPFNLLQFLPIVTLMAAILTLSRMAKSNELTPIKGSGISMHRVILPMFLVAVAVSGLMVLGQEWFIPHFAEQIQASRLVHQSDVRKSDAQLIDKSHDGYDLVVFCDSFSRKKKTMTNVLIEKLTKNNKPRTVGTYTSNRISRAFVDRVKWEDGRWRCYNDSGEAPTEVYLARRKNNQADMEQPLPVLDLSYSPAEVALKVRNVSVSLLGGADTQFMRWKELKAYRDAHPYHLSEQVALYQRATLPISNLILFLLGVPYVLRRDNRSTLVGIAAAMVVCFAFYSVSIACQSLGSTGSLQPLMAATLPIAAFLAIAIYNFDSIPT